MTDVMKVILAAAGLPASDEEIAAYAVAYGPQRAGVDALYEVAAARYVDPALRLQAQARIEGWAINFILIEPEDAGAEAPASEESGSRSAVSTAA